MGVVYRALDTELERTVAVKLLPAEWSRDEEAIARFRREAKTASALDHRNICTIYDFGQTAEERPFLVMAYYEGETLRERLRAGPLPIAEALALLGQLAAGLDAAHARGVIHRDIKPGNLLLTRHGELKILDFGIAKVAGLTVTRIASTVGTVTCMSPEQCLGRGVDARTDLWSAGVVLYQMLAGEPPFQGEREAAMLRAILEDEPRPLREGRCDVPAGVEALLARLLEKNPEKRLPSARTLADAVAALRAGSPLPAEVTMDAARPSLRWRLQRPGGRRRVRHGPTCSGGCSRPPRGGEQEPGGGSRESCS